MKTFNWILTGLILVLSTGIVSAKTNVQKATFGIYEISNKSEIPGSLIDLMKTKNIKFNENVQSQAVGYLLVEDSAKIKMDLSSENLKMIKTVYPVDNSKKHFEFAVLKIVPAISLSDIQITKNKGNKVEIYFTLSGARKWADFTKKNIGKMVAFVIDNQIYTMPLVQAEIRSGEAIIVGLKDEKMAENISVYLNSSLLK